VSLAVLLTCFVYVATAESSEIGSASSFASNFNDALLDVMKHADELGYDGRVERLKPLLSASFDIPFMARFTLGRRWKSLDEASQHAWDDKFAELTTATYAGRFNGYTGEEFVTMGEEPAAQETTFVKTKIIVPDQDEVELTYRMRQAETGWRIIDVYYRGTVSELALRRSDYSAVVRRDGFAKLLEVVDAKIADLKAGKVDE
jgi:phospholipid transport system substrate-binding protein